MDANLKRGIEKATAIIISVVATINVILNLTGHPVLPISDADITTVVSVAGQLIGYIMMAYCNFNVSKAAKEGQVVTDALKAGKDVEVKVDGELK